jgi:hypothetical protein
MKRANMGFSYKQQTLFFNITTIYAYQLRFTSVSSPLRGWRPHFLIKNVSATPKVDDFYDALVWIRADIAVYCPVSAFAHVGFVEQETFDARSAVESDAKCKSIQNRHSILSFSSPFARQR